jgi:hypothetical protein
MILKIYLYVIAFNLGGQTRAILYASCSDMQQCHYSGVYFFIKINRKS